MDDKFDKALEGKNIPILTLDNKWHKIFTQRNCDDEVKKLENELNDLLKKQGKANTETKEIKKLKKKLMDEIVNCADSIEQGKNDGAEQKIEDNKRLINDCNQKIENYQEELLELPRQISVANKKLMLLSMQICYETLEEDSKEIEEIAEWINQIRIELKKKVIRKQEMEVKDFELYSYMHDIFGADVIEIFDMKYNPEMKRPIPKSEQLQEQTKQEKNK